jgi:phage tail-like protein
MPGQGASAQYFTVEIDGVTAIRASEVSGLKIDHTEVKFFEGNRPNPHIVRGHFEVGAVTFKHAQALNQTGTELMQWLQDFIRGIVTDRRGMRVIQFDEDGIVPVYTYELLKCVPKSFEQDQLQGGSTNASMFTFVVLPEDAVAI